MITIVIMGVTLTIVNQQWSVRLKRDREAELEFRGNRIKMAIELYAADYQVRKGSRPNIYPLQLEQLVEGPKHYLQKVYKDPITGDDFDLVRIDGEIHGVRSRSTEPPFATAKFHNAQSYNQMIFLAQKPQGTGLAPCDTGGDSLNSTLLTHCSKGERQRETPPSLVPYP